MFTHFVLTMDTSNAAFEESEDGCRAEVVRILRAVADDVENGTVTASSIRDSNGNAIGNWRFIRVGD